MTQGLLGFDEVPLGGQFGVQSTDRGVFSGLIVDPNAVVAASTLFAETKFVAKNGVDATADGSVAKPFLTIQAAITSITDAASAKPYGVIVMPGVYTDTFAVAPWIYVQGISALAVFLNPVTANWISAGFAAGTQDGGVSNVTLLTNLTVDFSLVASAGAGSFKLTDVILGSAVALAFKGNNVGNVVQLGNLLSIGPTSSPLTLTNITSNVGSANLRNGVLTISSTDAYTTQHRCESLSTGGVVNVTWTGANTANFLVVTFYSSPLPLNPTQLNISGAGAQVYTRGEVQVAAPNADTTFSFGRIPNAAGATIIAVGADNTIIANPSSLRTYTFEGAGSPGTRVRFINQSPFILTIAFAGGASAANNGVPTYVMPFQEMHLYASTATVWNVEQIPQFGKVQLAAGVSAFIPADINLNSTITATLKIFNGAAGTPAVLDADRVNGTRAGGGGFKVHAIVLATGADLATDNGTYDWQVIGNGAGT